jgi:hypothetical protein
VTADPSRTLEVDVLANDIFPPGTTPAIEPLRAPPPGVSEKNGIVTIKPGSRGTSLVIPYTDTDGLATSSSDLIVHFQRGFDNPPVTSPVVAKQLPGHQIATADVLKHVTDIDDPTSALKLVSVDGAAASGIHGGTVTLPVGTNPTVWTYHVRDAEGAQATGSIYVGGSSATLPYLKPGSVLHVPLGGSATVNLADYVITPKHNTQPYLTTEKEIFEEPGGMFARTVNTPTQQSLTVRAGNASGPADLIFQVTDTKNLSAKGADTAMITLPVIVGKPTPKLECPVTPISVPESGTVSVDVAAICHVWEDPTNVKPISYSGALAASVQGISLATSGSVIKITAVHANAGAQGTINVGVNGANTAKLPLIITKLPPPTMRPVPQIQAQAGKPVSINLAPYLSNASLPAADFAPAIVRITPTNGGPAASISGTTATFTPPNGEHKTYAYTVAMSDSGVHTSRPLATASLSVVVTDVPSIVTGLRAGAQVQSDQVQLQWNAPDAGGLQITKYVVSDEAGQTTCFNTACTIRGLHNGTTYNFQVTAYNTLGPSKRPSAPASATPDAVPSAVTGLRVSAEADGTVTYQWQQPRGDFSTVTTYLVSGGAASGYQQIQSGARVVTDVVHTPNGTPVSFSVRPVDHLGVEKAGPAVTETSAIASGQPSPPTAPSITGTNVAGGGTKAFTLSWNQVAPNGRGNTYYEVLDSGKPASCVGDAQWFTATTCTVQVPNSGKSYSYQIVAANEAGVPGQNQPIEGTPAGHQSPPSGGAAVIAAGEPASVSVTLKPTGDTGQATLSYTAGASNGGTGTITCVNSSISCSFAVPASGGTGTKAITDLTDGQAYSVELQYCNGANNNQSNSTLQITPCVTSAAASATPYGPILAPTLTASANGTAVTLTGSVDANGGNVSVAIADDGGGESHSCGTAGPTGTIQCSWTESGLRYAATYKYTLTATDASGNSRTAVTAKASATTPQPPAINGTTLTATANGTSITLQGSANGNGLPIAVTIKSSDGNTHTCSGSGTVPCSWTESSLKYQTTYNYTLTAVDASDYKRTSTTASASAKTGDAPAITGATLNGSVNGTSISVNGSVNNGGLAANVVLRDNNTGATGSCSTSGNVVSCSLNESGLNYSTTYNYTLTATDASGYGRAPQSANWSGTTVGPPPPSPTVAVVIGPATSNTAYCNYGSPCNRVEATTANFSGTVTCNITASTYGLAGFTSWTQGPNATSYGNNYQNGGTVTITCTDGTHTASGSGPM